jgi:sugar phosphate isomerase/epimerase
LRKKVNDYEKKLVDVFSEIDSYLNNKNINLLIEPNTASYGGEYFFNLNEIIGFIDKNKLINIKTMIDTHNIILENGDPIIEFETNFNYIYHIHISEPKLKTNDVLDSLKKFSEIYF